MSYQIHEPSPRAKAQGVKLFVLLGIALLLIAFGKTALQMYTDWLWFVHDARQPEVFSKSLRTEALLWAIGLIVGFFLVHLNASRALKSESVYSSAPRDENARAAANVLGAIQKFARWLSIVVALIVGIGIANQLAGAYRELWMFQSSVSFGRKDPLFGLDLSFFVFRLPWLQTVTNMVFSALAVALVLTALGYLATHGLAKVAGVQLSRDSMRFHVSVLGGATLIAFGARLYLSRYFLGVQEGTQFVGPGYAQSQVVQFYWVVSLATVLVGVLTMLNAKLWKPWRVPSYGVPILLVTGLVLFGIVPSTIQKFTVDPNLLVKEKPYALRAIESTRFAYGLDKFEVRDFVVRPEPTPAELQASGATLESMRLWDPSVLQRVFDERQSLRPYYEFYDVDVDRYTVQGKQRMVMLAPRDINYGGLAPKSQNWQNRHLRYTHGFGVVVSPANETISSGQPRYWLSNFPPEQGNVFPLEQQRIYFSHFPADSPERNGYVLLKSRLQEFDYPGKQEKAHVWNGTRGVPIDGALAKFAFSTLLGEIKLYTTNDIDADTRIVTHRDIIDRASRVYPFLQFDSDPYVVLLDGRVSWIIDAYTTSGMVPYSAKYGELNYIRNSVKILVDAYSGDMSAYAVEPEEPVLRAWMRVFPGLVRPLSEVPPGLKAHFRYAESLFAAQSEILTQYHVTDPVKFLSNEDAWQVPLEIGRQGTQEPIEPYYVQIRIPGEDKDGFMLIRPFSPRTKNNMIGWMAAHCDPDDYGRVVLYRFPRDTQTQGPLQMEASFAADPVVADINRQFNNDQSSIVPGNLLVIPIGSSLLYVKPLFLESKSRAIPELRKVVLGLQNRVVVGDTYDEALNKLFGKTPLGQARPEEGEDFVRLQAGQQLPTQDAADARPELLEVLKLLDQADAALRSGDFAKYGELQKQAREKLRSLTE